MVRSRPAVCAGKTHNTVLIIIHWRSSSSLALRLIVASVCVIESYRLLMPQIARYHSKDTLESFSL